MDLVAQHVSRKSVALQAASDVEQPAHELERPGQTGEQVRRRQRPAGNTRAAELMDFGWRNRLDLKLRSGQDSDVERQWDGDGGQKPRAFPERQGEPGERQRQQGELDERREKHGERERQQAAHIGGAPVSPGRVGEPQGSEGGGHVGVDENAVTQNGGLQRTARGEAERHRFAEQLAAPMPEQEDDHQGEDQERQAGIEQQAARADVGAAENLRADDVGIAIFPARCFARQGRVQQARDPAANRPGERRRVGGLEHVFAEPVRVCRGEVGGFVDCQTEAPRLINQ